MTSLLLAFYGDDITGSTDAMDALSRQGVRTVLFLDPPNFEDIRNQFEDVQVVGVAGTSRSMKPEEMDTQLPRVFRRLSQLDAPIIHYKICSTFDSSSDVGSIGRAIDIASDHLNVESIPVIPAAPPLGRYVAFGNMFARGEDGIYRLDRHPTMSKHPVTPMDEGDLQRHLAKQTDKSMGLVNLLTIQKGSNQVVQKLDSHRDSEEEIVFFDTVSEDDLYTIGQATWDTYAETNSKTSFIVGSSGVEYALSKHWKSVGVVDGSVKFDSLPEVDNLIVMSGSAAPITENQITTALINDFVGIRINTTAMVDPDSVDAERQRVIKKALDGLRNGKSVIIYTARGPNDPAIEETKEHANDISNAPDNVGRFIGEQQGDILRQLLKESDVTRVCVAGGDTCGYVVPKLDIYALEPRFPLAPGAPLCQGYSQNNQFDNIEIALKGGQLGDEGYFIRAKEGVRRKE